MGNISSTTDRSYELTPQILSLLKPFGIFSEFPKDRIEADRVISNRATNALKYVSSSFSNRLGGHNKRKRDPSGDLLLNTTSTDLFSTPARRSQRRMPIVTLDSSENTTSPTSSADSQSVTSQSVMSSYPSTLHISPNISSALSYRVLLPNDLFRLNEGDIVILVVDDASFGFKKSISDYIDDDILLIHSRQQQDKLKYEFSMKLTAFNIKEAVLDGSLSAKDQLLRYKQGDGITLRSVEDHGLKYNVCFKDFFVGIYNCLKKLAHYSNTQIFQCGRENKRSTTLWTHLPIIFACGTW